MRRPEALESNATANDLQVGAWNIRFLRNSSYPLANDLCLPFLLGGVRSPLGFAAHSVPRLGSYFLFMRNFQVLIDSALVHRNMTRQIGTLSLF